MDFRFIWIKAFRGRKLLWTKGSMAFYRTYIEVFAHVAIIAYFGYCLSLKVNSWVSDLADPSRILA
jgi:hypothetical protein